jgi:hypothetical protein
MAARQALPDRLAAAHCLLAHSIDRARSVLLGAPSQNPGAGRLAFRQEERNTLLEMISVTVSRLVILLKVACKQPLLSVFFPNSPPWSSL